jgi:hypothetical protein
MTNRRRKFANSKKLSKILHGCILCGSKTYLSVFRKHQGHNYCGCGGDFIQVSKKESRGVLWL